LDNLDIDLKDIVAILRRQRQLILMTVAIVIGLAFAYILSATPIYRTTALIMVDNRSTDVLNADARSETQSQVMNSRVESEVEILKSQAMALAVVQAENLIEDPYFGPQLGWSEKFGMALGVDLSSDGLRSLVGLGKAEGADRSPQLLASAIKKLQDSVTVRRRGLTYLIEVSVDLPDGNRAAEIANAYTRVYLERQIQTKSGSMLNARDVLRRQIETAQAQMIAGEISVNTFLDDNLARLEAESGDPAIALLREELVTAQQAKQKFATDAAQVQAAIDAGDWSTVTSTLQSEALRELDRQRSELAKRLADAQPSSTTAIDLSAELEKLTQTMQQEATTGSSSLKAQLDSLNTKESATREELRTSLLRSSISPELLAQLFNLQQSVTNARTQYQALLLRDTDLSTLANVQVADARVVSEALPSTKAAAPNRTRILGLALIGGLMMGTVLAFLKEYYVGGVASASQLQNVMQTRVPVTVPQVDIGQNAGPSDTVITAPLSPYAETFRKLRAAIDMDALRKADPNAPEGLGRGGKVVLITSALPAEGKSTTAISLARTYAMAGAHTLLIDADLRKPTIAMRMGVECEVGLFEYLSKNGGSDTNELKAVQDPLSQLTMLTAGKRSTVPTDQLINSVAFRSLIKVARDNFDVIIIDSPPLLPVVDTRYLAQYADAVVQVVRFITTTQSEAREAAAQTQEMMRPDASFYAVLSHEERGGARYGYYAKYGGYYGQDAA